MLQHYYSSDHKVQQPTVPEIQEHGEEKSNKMALFVALHTNNHTFFIPFFPDKLDNLAALSYPKVADYHPTEEKKD